MRLTTEFYSASIGARRLIIKDRAEELARRFEDDEATRALAAKIFTTAAEIHYLKQELESITQNTKEKCQLKKTSP